MNIHIIGDTHGISSYYNEFINSDDELLLSVGDFGFLWSDSDVLNNTFLNHFEKRYPYKKIIVTCGNHENYNSIEQLPLVKIYGANARLARKNVFYLERSEIMKIDGLTFLSIGGADSIDRYIRRINSEWWEQEKISNEDIIKAIKNSENENIDIVITHSPPWCINKELFTFSAMIGDSDANLDRIWHMINFKQWICGHVHDSVDFSKDGKNIKILGIGETAIIETRGN